MGSLIYDGFGTPVRVDDRELAHLKMVITTKLRRAESFALSWLHSDGDGRSTVWVHPAINLRFDFDDPEPPQLDPEWLARLADEGVAGMITFSGTAGVPRRAAA
ncbi:hypothetical protein [Microbacterium sp. NPDC096154]|uniref:DUF7882 family protein n=1 Tax=Microbacterium sp. NPDC096154 TaxID=3155549 RepID=UPI00333096C0